ncbi:MAG: STAS domain-containing protein [Chitinophagaceae bacterium]|nr:STAS domain-containing protein [Chitinophagaceae bacterium]
MIEVVIPHLSANMTDDLCNQLLLYLRNNIKNIILNLKEVKSMDDEAAEKLVRTQQKFYDENASFVFCELNKEIENILDQSNLLELMNVTPTESEAADIVQMEEIEREILNEDDTFSS